MAVLSIADAEALVVAALTRCRTGAEQAQSVARALVAAEADGLKGHGLSRLPSYAAQAKVGKVDGFAQRGDGGQWPADERPQQCRWADQQEAESGGGGELAAQLGQLLLLAAALQLRDLPRLRQRIVLLPILHHGIDAEAADGHRGGHRHGHPGQSAGGYPPADGASRIRHDHQRVLLHAPPQPNDIPTTFCYKHFTCLSTKNVISITISNTKSGI